MGRGIWKFAFGVSWVKVKVTVTKSRKIVPILQWNLVYRKLMRRRGTLGLHFGSEGPRSLKFHLGTLGSRSLLLKNVSSQ